MRHALLVVLGIIGCGQALNAATIKIAGAAWCPLNCVAETGEKNRGSLIDIVEQIFKAKGMAVDYREMPWARAKSEAASGAVDALIGAVPGDAPELVHPREPIGYSQICFYTRKDSTWTYQNIDSLKAIKLGILRDQAYWPEVDKYIEANKNDTKLIYTQSAHMYLESNFDMLGHKRIDATLDDANVAAYLLKRKNLARDFKVAGCLQGAAVYVAFTPAKAEAKEMVKVIDEGMDQIRKSGELSRILEKYGLEDWAKKDLLRVN